MSDPVEIPDDEAAGEYHHEHGAGGEAGAVNANKWSKNGYGAPVNRQSGKFTREESELVQIAIKEYCAAKQIDTTRLCAECDHKAELKGAWMEIAKRLPHRSVQSVYRHGIRQMHPYKRGAWAEHEVLRLADLVNKHGKKWSAIQAKLNRSADSCRDKYREMSDDFIKGRWKEHETEMLKRVIREQLNADANVDMKELGKMVEEQGIQIPWSTISKRMGKRSRLSCFKKWQKMTGLGHAGQDDGMGQHLDADGGFGGANKRSADVADGIGDDDEDGTDESPLKRQKVGDDAQRQKMYAVAPTAGAAAAMAAAGQQPQPQGDFDVYSAKIAAETVEAVELPDTEGLVHHRMGV